MKINDQVNFKPKYSKNVMSGHITKFDEFNFRLVIYVRINRITAEYYNLSYPLIYRLTEEEILNVLD